MESNNTTNEALIKFKKPKPVFERGYKGKGMCSHCAYQSVKVPNSNRYLCGYYAATCMSVSRNCPGIKSLK